MRDKYIYTHNEQMEIHINPVHRFGHFSMLKCKRKIIIRRRTRTKRRKRKWKISVISGQSH